ncbi:DinB family protein [Chitinophagaceae bacterium LB-8]|uniref:DinB family protein n=1 Tax=Paraflavisolibacter caeni TaxID=2982496 RepID=A0A9X3BJC2_9BACT|nr:DinB family protein [Paraflavisolibacter caeni]MCU7552607.1 DinB family protein [Paraflavisolibacter caeni]
MEIIDQLDQVKQEALKHFSVLSLEQLNWKSAPSNWSIAQCLDHLIVFNQLYFPTFERVLHNHYKSTSWERLSPFSKVSGLLMIKLLGPGSKTKFKTPKVGQPCASELPASIVYDFAQHQHDLKNYYLALAKKNINSVVISSPASNFITYYLNDVLKLIAQHQVRHLNQSMTVFHHPNFPK